MSAEPGVVAAGAGDPGVAGLCVPGPCVPGPCVAGPEGSPVDCTAVAGSAVLGAGDPPLGVSLLHAVKAIRSPSATVNTAMGR